MRSIRNGFFLLFMLANMPALADVDIYLDKNDWSDAAGSPRILEDFESFVVDTPFNNSAPLALANGVTLTSVSLGPKIDVPPHDNGESDVNGTASIRANNSDEPIILFDEPVAAWGGEFVEFQDDQVRTTIEFYLDGVDVDSWVVGDIPSPARRFIGFVGQGDTTFDEIRFVNTNASDTFGIDDMEFTGVAASEAVPVPSVGPVGIVLLIGLTGLLGVAGTRKLI